MLWALVNTVMNLRAMQKLDNYWPAERLSVFQKWLWSMELVLFKFKYSAYYKVQTNTNVEMPRPSLRPGWKPQTPFGRKDDLHPTGRSEIPNYWQVTWQSYSTVQQ